MAGGSGPGAPPGWPLKPDPAIDAAAAAARREAEEQREREQRERDQRERERQRRDREERERREKEKEEKLRKEQQERERERERREKERREAERREMERERLLQQQRDSAKQQQQQQQVQRDRSPLRNGMGGDPNDIRIKDEPRKDDPTEMMMRAGDRYHHAMHPYMTAGRQYGPPPHMVRPMLPPSLGPPPMSHFAPPPGPHGHPGWPMLDPYRDPFAAAYNPLRYNPIMEAIRADEERAKAAMNAYAAHAHQAHMRAKEPSPIPPPNSGPSPHHRSPLGGPPNGKMMPGGGQPPPSQPMQSPMTNGGMVGMDGKKEDQMR